MALLTAAGLAGGFWPIMTARQALRSSALPAVFALAVLFFWIGLFRNRVSGRNPVSSHYSPLAPFLIAGLLLGLSFYTYLPARIMWLALPVLVGYGWLCRRDLANRPARGLLFTLAVAALVAAPLLLYLAARPALEVRVGELSAPLRAATGGDFAPLWANATAALRLFTIEGDQTWRYNVPGRPLLPGVLGWLFYAGLLVAGWQVVVGLKRKATTDYTDFTDLRVLKSVKSVVAFSSPGAFLALVWLALGFTPVLVTGPGLSTTQAIGMLPVLYVFPALALVAGWRAITNYELRITNAAKEPHAKVSSLRSWRSWRSLREVFSSPATRYLPLASLLVVLLYVTVATASARAYFGLWANSPEVRVQYETTMVTALRYLDAHGRGAAAVSTITPGQYLSLIHI